MTMSRQVRREGVDVPVYFGLVEQKVEDRPIVPEIEPRTASVLADICRDELQTLTPVADPRLHMCESCMRDVYDRYVREPGSNQFVTQV